MSGRNKNISECRVSMTPDHLKKQIFLERDFYVSRQRGILKSNSCKCCTLTAIYPLLRAAPLEILSITDCIVSFQDTTTGTDPPKIRRHMTCCKKQWSRFHRAFQDSLWVTVLFSYLCIFACATRGTEIDYILHYVAMAFASVSKFIILRYIFWIDTCD